MKRVFLTGATGAIGSALVPLYLDKPDTRVVLLMRAKRGRGVSERLDELGRFWEWDRNDARWSRITAIEGDAALPKFGVSDADYEALSATTTHIVHCAGAVKMTLPLEEARAHAVVPAQSTLELARLCQRAGSLRKVEVISTVGVGGRTPGLIPERPMPEVTRFHNTYEAAKAEAEGLIFSAWDELPITVHRPSMVVGDSMTGRIIHFQVFYHLCDFLSGGRTAGLMPSLKGAALDIVPVDYVARAIHWASCNRDCQSRVLHLCSGPVGAVALEALVDHVRSRAVNMNALPRRLRYLPLWAFRSALPILSLMAPSKVRRALGNLELFLAYLDELQSFDNRQTKALLETARISLPPWSAYLDCVLDYHRQCDYAAIPTAA